MICNIACAKIISNYINVGISRSSRNNRIVHLGCLFAYGKNTTGERAPVDNFSMVLINNLVRVRYDRRTISPPRYTLRC
jgi:hypothetical protein